MRAVNWALIVGLLIAGCGVSEESEPLVASATPDLVETATEIAEATLNEEEATIAAWLRTEAIELKTDDPTTK